jgi:dihydroorotase-like cyclic amidohydrolase
MSPPGAVSKGREGKEMAELGDMAGGGAVAFSDDGAPVQHAGLMRRALEYARSLDRPILAHEEDLDLNPHGHMHEGAVSTRLGLPGIPAVAEEVMIARDVLLAQLTGGHVHVCHISTAGAVAPSRTRVAASCTAARMGRFVTTSPEIRNASSTGTALDVSVESVRAKRAVLLPFTTLPTSGTRKRK